MPLGCLDAMLCVQFTAVVHSVDLQTNRVQLSRVHAFDEPHGDLLGEFMPKFVVHEQSECERSHAAVRQALDALPARLAKFMRRVSTVEEVTQLALTYRFRSASYREKGAKETDAIESRAMLKV